MGVSEYTKNKEKYIDRAKKYYQVICNLSIGKFGHSLDLLARAFNYLETSNE